jgi:L-threonylcarbamoyladenylate synthase
MTLVTIEEAVEIVRAGGIVAYPTETVYGLACKLEAGPISRLKKLKGRDAGKPILIAVASAREIGKYAVVPRKLWPFLEKILPGPIAVVLDRKASVPASLTGGKKGVGIRVPAHPVARKLARDLGAITSTSANLAGRPPARTFSQVEKSGLGLLPILPGKCKFKKPSTLFDARRGKVLREGIVPAEKVYRLWRKLVKD